MSQLVLIRGLPGSGKSTLAQEWVNKGFRHCEADDYHMIDGVYTFKLKEAPVAHAFCIYKSFYWMEHHKDVVVSNTFTKISEMLPYVRFAQFLEIPYRVIECKESYGSKHGVPSETMDAMKARWEEITKESFAK
jgi:hypothetical protein